MPKLGEKIPQNYPDGPTGVCGICKEAIYSKLLLGAPIWMHEVSTGSHDAEPTPERSPSC